MTTSHATRIGQRCRRTKRVHRSIGLTSEAGTEGEQTPLRGYALNVKGRGEFDRLQGEIQELIDELWQVPRFSGLRRGFRPQVDVVRTDDPATLRVLVELPGVDPDDVKIFADDRTLVIGGGKGRAVGGREFPP